jgi:hypothetical protein
MPDRDRPASTPSDFFISHVSADAAWAEWIRETLLAEGRSVMTAQAAVTPGEEWPQWIEAQLRRSQALLVVASEAAMRSPWVRAELAFARARSLPIAVLAVDETASLPADLAGTMIIDVAGLPLEDARERLVSYVRHGSAAPAISNIEIRETPKAAINQAPAPPHFFVNRAAELAALEEVFLRNASTPTTAVLVGPAGIGKSAIAAQFARSKADHFESVRWTKIWSGSDLRAHPVDPPRSGHRRPLVVLDDVPDYHSVAELLASNRDAHVLMTSRNSNWARPFHVVAVSALTQEASMTLLARAIPDISPTDAREVVQALAGLPVALQVAAALGQRRSVSSVLAQLRTLRTANESQEGFYYLDTDDPRAISEFERALEDLLDRGARDVELLPAQRGSWSRWWRRRYPPDRVDEIADKAERAAEVSTLSRPESEANRSNAEAIARLLEASAAIPNMVVISGSVLFIKVTDEGGVQVVSKTLTATEIRRFQEQQDLLSNPLQALHFLQEGREQQRNLPSAHAQGD